MRGARSQDVMKPPGEGFFNDAYIVYELMDTDLHQVIRSAQPLSGASLPRRSYCAAAGATSRATLNVTPRGAADDHIQYFLYQARGVVDKLPGSAL